MEIQRLNLLSPIYYALLSNEDPFNYREDPTGEEKLFCFDLDETQYLSFEPDKKTLLGTLVSCGKVIESSCQNEAGESSFQLPKGDYLFAQKREILSRDEIIDMAVEIQMEGLWQRLKPGNKLYLRYLFEDGSSVTQLFRPLGCVTGS
ncbi:MAG: hypothetical protein LBH42_06495 [Treponema sp.]|nr:hypothetical protein [Treponema sp.]